MCRVVVHIHIFTAFLVSSESSSVFAVGFFLYWRRRRRRRWCHVSNGVAANVRLCTTAVFSTRAALRHPIQKLGNPRPIHPHVGEYDKYGQKQKAENCQDPSK